MKVGICKSFIVGERGGDKYIFVNLVLQFFHKRKKKEEIGDLKVSLNLCMLPGKTLLRISFYLSGKTYRLSTFPECFGFPE